MLAAPFDAPQHLQYGQPDFKVESGPIPHYLEAAYQPGEDWKDIMPGQASLNARARAVISIGGRLDHDLKEDATGE